jgi:hypothetical protein
MPTSLSLKALHQKQCIKTWKGFKTNGPLHAIWLWLDSMVLLVRSFNIGDPAVPREGMGGRDEPTENGSQEVGGLKGKGTAQKIISMYPDPYGASSSSNDSEGGWVGFSEILTSNCYSGQ